MFQYPWNRDIDECTEAVTGFMWTLWRGHCAHKTQKPQINTTVWAQHTGRCVGKITKETLDTATVECVRCCRLAIGIAASKLGPGGSGTAFLHQAIRLTNNKPKWCVACLWHTYSHIAALYTQHSVAMQFQILRYYSVIRLKNKNLSYFNNNIYFIDTLLCIFHIS